MVTAITTHQILDDCKSLLDERGSDRDNGQERSMQTIVTAFNIITGHNLTEVEGWMFMEILKLVRIVGSKEKSIDSLMDNVSYGALMAEAAFKNIKLKNNVELRGTISIE